MSAALPPGLTLDAVQAHTQHAAVEGLLSTLALGRRGQSAEWELIGAFTAGHFHAADNAARHVAKYANRNTVVLQIGVNGALVRALEYTPGTA